MIDVGPDVGPDGKTNQSVISFHSRNGLVIRLEGAEEYITNKLLLGLERYNYWYQEGVVTGTITTWYSQVNDVIYAKYEDLYYNKK
jgi:hypothetical protein